MHILGRLKNLAQPKINQWWIILITIVLDNKNITLTDKYLTKMLLLSQSI